MAVYIDINNKLDNEESLNKNIFDFTDSQAKDEILRFCIKFPKERITTNTIIEKVFINASREKINFLLKEIAKYLGESKFILRFNESSSTSFVQTNELTKEFLSNVGFVNLELENQKVLKDKEEKSEVEFEKSKIDLRLKKWQIKTFWPIFIFAFIGFGFSVYNFINNLSSAKNVEQQEEKIVKMESELEKLQIFILNQKKADSLSNSKVLKTTENTRKSKDK